MTVRFDPKVLGAALKVAETAVPSLSYEESACRVELTDTGCVKVSREGDLGVVAVVAEQITPSGSGGNGVVQPSLPMGDLAEHLILPVEDWQQMYLPLLDVLEGRKSETEEGKEIEESKAFHCDAKLMASLCRKKDGEMIEAAEISNGSVVFKGWEAACNLAPPPDAKTLDAMKVPEGDGTYKIISSAGQSAAAAEFASKGDKEEIQAVALAAYNGYFWIGAANSRNHFYGSLDGKLPIDEGRIVYVPSSFAKILAMAGENDEAVIGWHPIGESSENGMISLKIAVEHMKMTILCAVPLISPPEDGSVPPMEEKEPHCDHAVNMECEGWAVSSAVPQLMAVAGYIPPGMELQNAPSLTIRPPTADDSDAETFENSDSDETVWASSGWQNDKAAAKIPTEIETSHGSYSLAFSPWSLVPAVRRSSVEHSFSLAWTPPIEGQPPDLVRITPSEGYHYWIAPLRSP